MNLSSLSIIYNYVDMDFSPEGKIMLFLHNLENRLVPFRSTSLDGNGNRVWTTHQWITLIVIMV